MAKKRAARTGKKWGNALGGFRTQNRKGGQFSSGFAGKSVGATAGAKSLTKGQRRFAEYDSSRKKARNKKIAKVAVGVAVVGAGVYATNRSYQNTKTAEFKTMHPVSLSATRGPRKMPKIPTKPKEIVTLSDGRRGTRAQIALGIDGVGSPVAFAPNTAFQIKSGKAPKAGLRARSAQTVGMLAAANATILQTGSTVRELNKAREKVERGQRGQVNPHADSAFALKNGRKPGNAGVPVIRDSRGVRIDVEQRANKTGLTDRGHREKPVTSEFAGGDWQDSEMDKHFDNPRRSVMAETDTGMQRDTRKDRNKGKRMSVVTLEASPGAMHRSSKERSSVEVFDARSAWESSKAKGSPKPGEVGVRMSSGTVITHMGERTRIANGIGSAANRTERSRRAKETFLAGNQVIDPAQMEGFGPSNYVSGKMEKTRSFNTAPTRTTSRGKVVYEDRNLQKVMGDPARREGYRFNANPHLSRSEVNYARAFENQHRSGKSINERQLKTYESIMEKSTRNSKTSRGDNRLPKPTLGRTAHGRQILNLHKQQGVETPFLRGLDRETREKARDLEARLEREGMGTSGMHLQEFKRTTDIAGENEVVGYAQFSANGTSGVDKIGRNGHSGKSNRNKKNTAKSSRR